jgi:hypothetical protein
MEKPNTLNKQEFNPILHKLKNETKYLEDGRNYELGDIIQMGGKKYKIIKISYDSDEFVGTKTTIQLVEKK